MPERDPDPSPFQRGTSRRTVLRAAGLVALTGAGAGVLAACSADGGVAAPSATSAAPSSPAAPSSSAASSPAASSSAPASPSASASASSSAPAPSGPSVATADVPVGGGVILDDSEYVVTQPTKGEFKAFSSICTHKGCPVSEIRGDAIVCTCHGSRFSTEDGSVLQAPADRPLKEAEVTVAGGEVVVRA